MNKKVIIFGNGKLAELVYCVGKEEGSLEVEAFTADKLYISGEHFLDLPLVDFETVLEIYPPEAFEMLVLTGYSKMRDRKDMYERAKAKGYNLKTFVSKHATCYQSAGMGENNIIFGGVYMGPFGHLGNNNIIRPKTYVGHDAKIGSHIYIAPGCSIGGHCTIGTLSYIGIGATIIDNISVADETLIGAGSLVLKDTESCSKYIGRPAKKTGEHTDTGIIIGG
ncbi:MAG: acetyltransferase [Candidatus Hodarchaeota archaeon]